MNDATWTVGRVARRCGVNVSALHFYERKGLIRSWRNAGNQRRYKPDVLRRIAVIKTAQKLGISLAEIQRALANLPDSRTPTTADWEKLSTHWREDLDARIRHMERLRDLLTGCIGCGCLSMKNCPIYNAGDRLSERGDGAILLEQGPDVLE